MPKSQLFSALYFAAITDLTSNRVSVSRTLHRGLLPRQVVEFILFSLGRRVKCIDLCRRQPTRTSRLFFTHARTQVAGSTPSSCFCAAHRVAYLPGKSLCACRKCGQNSQSCANHDCRYPNLQPLQTRHKILLIFKSILHCATWMPTAAEIYTVFYGLKPRKLRSSFASPTCGSSPASCAKQAFAL